MLIKQYSRFNLEAGTDEAGRGCLAGPVVAAAVILPKDFHHPLLNDSKKLPLKTRNLLRSYIIEHAVCYGVSFVFQEEIDSINILNASILAMHKAIASLSVKPEFILVDGNRFKSYENIGHQTIVKGDGKYMNIAAASILAKTFRDEYMEKIHEEYPGFNWAKNKGYPTLTHREAIRQFGLTEHHRKTFILKADQLRLNL
ncbi:MAG: ribonuclease HII [Flavobacteriaceae bacterium]|nr:ribonuclease HII [Flavobacteriaceae bacterium]